MSLFRDLPDPQGPLAWSVSDNDCSNGCGLSVAYLVRAQNGCGFNTNRATTKFFPRNDNYPSKNTRYAVSAAESNLPVTLWRMRAEG